DRAAVVLALLEPVLEEEVAPLEQVGARRGGVAEDQVLPLALARALVRAPVQAALFDLEDLGAGLEARALPEVRDVGVVDLEREVVAPVGIFRDAHAIPPTVAPSAPSRSSTTMNSAVEIGRRTTFTCT